MNVLGISGTPREMGNSHILPEHSILPFKDAGWEATILRLRELTVKSCIACDYCRSHKSRCEIEDDMGVFYDAFRKTGRYFIIQADDVREMKREMEKK